MRTLYRIFTESTGTYRERAIAETAARFEAFTAYDAVGYWQGTRESSLVIEVLQSTDVDISREIIKLAHAIRVANDQQAVLVQSTDVGTYTAMAGL